MIDFCAGRTRGGPESSYFITLFDLLQALYKSELSYTNSFGAAGMYLTNFPFLSFACMHGRFEVFKMSTIMIFKILFSAV